MSCRRSCTTTTNTIHTRNHGIGRCTRKVLPIGGDVAVDSAILLLSVVLLVIPL